MGKKIDLNARIPSNTRNNRWKNNYDFSHHYNARNQLSEEKINQSNSNSQNYNGLGTMPFQRDYDLPKNVNLKIKMPLPIKATMTAAIIVSLFIPLVLFMVIFSRDEDSEDYSKMASKCQTVTVVDTDCDSSGGNCTNKYDGEVSFEDYIAGVVAAEAESNSNNLEYYKTLAIVARTYFFDNFQSSCEVSGNQEYQSYIDVEDSPASSTIKKAIEETKGLAMVKENKLINGSYSDGCVVNADSEYYYIRYGSLSYDEPNIQKIPKNWDATSISNGLLEKYYSQIEGTGTNEYTRECYEANNDYGMSSIGALYLITEENYNYEQTLKYYYGEDIEIKNINTPTSEIVNGFINPVNNASCTDSFGCRYHPIKGSYEFHQAIDLGASSGESVYATKAGKVISVTKSVPGYSLTYSYGNNVLIDHGDNTKTRYAHLLYGSIPDNIQVGSTVEQGEIIGQVGATGSATGPHLHYEIYVNNSYQNPVDYLDLSAIGNQGNCNVYANTPLSTCGQ